jgi:tetratricopeptide (TPR) repeat protein
VPSDLPASDPAKALAKAKALIAQTPYLAEAHRMAGRAYRALGQTAEAEAAEMQAIRMSIHDPDLQRAGQALAANDLGVAEPILKERLRTIPTDVAAIRMLAELAGRIGRYRDAENLLRRALELAPKFLAARSNLATVLHRQARTEEALAELDLLLAAEPDSPTHNNLKAAALGRIGDYEEALGLYERVLAVSPAYPKIWMSYGHVLKTVGRQEDSIVAYRQALGLKPDLGEVWWSLANLKTVKFDAADIAKMQQALTQERLSAEDRFHLDFALGKALDDQKDAERAFAHYAAANALRREQLDYDPTDISRQVDRAIALFTPAFFDSRQGAGCDGPDPIFILGMPRAGSTLIEQILASHSQVEGTMELPDIPALATRTGEGPQRYPTSVSDLSPEALKALGEDYLQRTRIQRKQGRPFFIDKLPNNWLYTAFIHLILPKAKIIDARRDPMDCCFSNFRQHFARGQSFSYSLEDMGQYYGDYVRLMRHLDETLPGRVHRVIHEDLLDKPETQIRALLDHLGLPFEEACLQFHETKRAVRTASSEQVRRPINRDGVGQWRPYEAHLHPLREALGDIAESWRR